MSVSDQTLRRYGSLVAGLSILAAPVGLILVAQAGRLDELVENYSLHGLINGLSYGVLGLVLIRSQPRNKLVWFFIAVGVFNGVSGVMNGVGESLAAAQDVPFEQIDTSGWPTGLATVTALLHKVDTLANFGLPTLGLLLAPTGRLLSRRWLPIAVISQLCVFVLWLTSAANWPERDDDNQEALVTGWAEVAFVASFSILSLSIVAAFVSLVLRYQYSDSMTRRRLRWVLFGSALFVLAIFPAWFGPEAPLLVVYPILAFSFGMAVWRDQLFDIDVVISRTLLFGFLAAFIGAVYVGVVFGLGALIGQQGGDNQALSLLATVVVAFLFHPARQRLERTANRLVYGARATPYEVLSDVSGRMARTESSEGLLDRMVGLVADGTGAERAIVWRWSDRGYEPLAVWPSDIDVEPVPSLADLEAVVPIDRAGELLGALSVEKTRGDDLIPTERRLLNALAGSAALVLDRARLHTALSGQADALTRSRRRLISAQDEERHRLEQQLQTGTQQQLSALATGLGVGADLALREGIEPVATQIVALVEQTQTAKHEIATLAQGMYPPVLESGGLTAAVNSLTATLPVAVQVRSTLEQPVDLDAELAAYFCIAEALTNVVKHAQATMVSVELDQQDAILTFEISDDGVGFDPNQHNGSSTGLAGLADRIDALDGQLCVNSAPGHGSTVSASIVLKVSARADRRATRALASL